MNPQRLQQVQHVAAPTQGDGSGGHRVFQDQVPADQPGDDLAERGVGVGVCASGCRVHGGQLGVDQGGQGGGDSRQDEGEDDPGAGVEGGSHPAQDEDAGADNGANTHGDQVTPAQHPFQTVGLILAE